MIDWTTFGEAGGDHPSRRQVAKAGDRKDTEQQSIGLVDVRHDLIGRGGSK